jgi:EpsI family protein
MMRTRVIVLILSLLGAAAAVERADRHEDIPLRMSFALFPMEIGEYQGAQNPPFTERVLEVLGLDDYLSRRYMRPNQPMLDLYIGYWQSQRTGDAIHSPQNCLPAAGWEPTSQGYLTFPDPRNPSGPQLSVNRYVIQKGLDRQLVLYWYQSRGRVVASEYKSKIYLVLDAARYNRTDAALVRVVAGIRPGPDGEKLAEAEALAFINELMPRVSQFLPD